MIEKNCWICKRTKKDLVEWATKKAKELGIADDMVEAILYGSENPKDQPFQKISLLSNEKHAVDVCPICLEIIEQQCFSEGVLLRLDEYLREHYKVEAQLEYIEKEDE